MTSQTDQPPFQPGDTVIHDSFGLGTVTNIRSCNEAENPARITWNVEAKFGNGVKTMLSSFLKLQAEQHRIDQIKQAIADYSRVSHEATDIMHALGNDIATALNIYLHKNKKLVFCVPPEGEWEGGKDYGDAAFSTHVRGYRSLEPLHMGLVVDVGDFLHGNSGWLRIILEMEKVGDEVIVSVLEKGSVTVPVAYREHLDEICELIFQSILRTFVEDVQLIKHGSDHKIGHIGFVSFEE